MLTYQQALEMIQKARVSKRFGAKAVKLENNTYLIQNGSEFQVVLHRTAVVTIYPNGAYQLKTGGWTTVTTKDRINAYSPVRVFQRKHQWYLENGKPFQDGMIVKVA